MDKRESKYQREWKSFFDTSTKKGTRTVITLALGLGLVGGYTIGHYGDTRITGTVATYKGGEFKTADLFEQLKNNTTGSGIVKSKLILETFNNSYGDSVSQNDIDKAKSFYASSGSNQSNKELEQLTRKQLAFEKGLRSKINVTDKEMKEAFDSYRQPAKIRFMVFSNETTADKVVTELEQGKNAEKLAEDNKSYAGDGSEIIYTNAYDYNYKDYSGFIPDELINKIYTLKNGDVKKFSYETESNNGSKETYYYVIKVDNIENKTDNWKAYKKDLSQLVKMNKISSNDEEVNKAIREVFKENNVVIKDEYLKKALKDYTG